MDFFGISSLELICIIFLGFAILGPVKLYQLFIEILRKYKSLSDKALEIIYGDLSAASNTLEQRNTRSDQEEQCTLMYSKEQRLETVNDSEEKMTLVEHLEELRERFIKSSVASIITTLFSFSFSDRIVRILMQPLGSPDSLRSSAPTEAIEIFTKTALFAGIILAMPVWLYQIIQFIVPALRTEEKRYLYVFTLIASLSFLLGVCLAYFAVLPFVLKYLFSFGTGFVLYDWEISKYISFVTRLLLLVGIMFEMPLIVFLLKKINVIDLGQLSFRHPIAILLAFVIACAITPGTAFFVDIVLTIGLLMLYEIGILLAKLT